MSFYRLCYLQCFSFFVLIWYRKKKMNNGICNYVIIVLWWRKNMNKKKFRNISILCVLMKRKELKFCVFSRNIVVHEKNEISLLRCIYGASKLFKTTRVVFQDYQQLEAATFLNKTVKNPKIIFFESFKSLKNGKQSGVVNIRAEIL